MAIILYSLGSVLLGAIPFALLLGWTRKVDIRKSGSGNPGATNLGRQLGVSWGVAAFVLDAGKGWLPVYLAPRVLDSAPREGELLLFAAAAVLGHCFSPFLGFRGGKGVATAAGALAALEPLLTLILLAVWGVAVAVFRTIGIALTVAAVAGAGVGAWRLFSPGDDGTEASKAVPWLLVVMGALIVFRHRSNLVRYFRPAAQGR